VRAWRLPRDAFSMRLASCRRTHMRPSHLRRIARPRVLRGGSPPTLDCSGAAPTRRLAGSDRRRLQPRAGTAAAVAANAAGTRATIVYTPALRSHLSVPPQERARLMAAVQNARINPVQSALQAPKLDLPTMEVSHVARIVPLCACACDDTCAQSTR